MKNGYANRIKQLRPSSGFLVPNAKERDKVLKEARELKKYGQIDFEVTTRETEPNSGKFKIIAL